MLLTIFVSFFMSCYGQTHFTRDVSFDGSAVQDPSSEVGVELFQSCARGCHDDMSCLSLIYNRYDGTCQLFPKIILSTLADASKSGNIMYKKNAEEAVCEVSTSVAKGRLLYIDGQKAGSKAKFVCDDFHFSDVSYGQCTTDGLWSDLDNPCVHMPGPNYNIQSNGRIAAGNCVVIHATSLLNASRCDISLKNEEDFILLITFRPADGHVVRNNRNGTWGAEERGVPYWPLTGGVEANMTLCVEVDLYKFYVDETEMFTFNHRMPISFVQYICIENFNVRSIVFTE